MDMEMFVELLVFNAFLAVAGALGARFVSKRQTIAAGADYRDPDRLTLIVYVVLGVLVGVVVAFFVTLMLGTHTN
jgi:hypothetical protein